MTEPNAPKAELILYQTEDGRTRIECRVEGEAEDATCKPFLQVHAQGEPSPEATIRRYRIVRGNGNRSGSHAILNVGVGFRAKSAPPRQEMKREVA